MEDIEELEKVVELRKEKCKGKIEHDTCIVGTKNLDNLIQRYKELKKNQGRVEFKNAQIVIGTNNKDIIDELYISKQKVKELKEKVHRILDYNAVSRGYQLIIDKKFEELLEL